jgi:hypothetical protein
VTSGYLGTGPGLEGRRRHRTDTEEHLGVVQPAELSALAVVGTGVQHIEIEDIGDTRLGVAAEVEVPEVEPVDGVVGYQSDLDGLAGGHDHLGTLVVRAVGGFADHSDVETGVVEPVTVMSTTGRPLEVTVALTGWVASTLFSVRTVKKNRTPTMMTGTAV